MVHGSIESASPLGISLAVAVGVLIGQFMRDTTAGSLQTVLRTTDGREDQLLACGGQRACILAVIAGSRLLILPRHGLFRS
jgi:hypothetical protein